MARDYSREYLRDKAKEKSLGVRINNETFEKFKEKVTKDGTTMSEFIKKCINEYINE